MNQRGYSGSRGAMALLLMLGLILVSLANAATVEDLQTGWDKANFQLLGKEQRESFEQSALAGLND